MRVLFLGSGAFGLPTLGALVEGHEVVGVVSQPDRAAGRGRQLTPTPVAAWAHERGLAVIKPEDVNDPAVVADLASRGASAAVVIAFGQKLGPAVVAAGGRLMVNLHASLLPRYRGAAPINWAILEGQTRTGVSVIGIAARMDAGDVYAQAATPIDPLETAGELHDRLALLGPGVVGSVLEGLARGALAPEAQDESQATKAPKLSKADGFVDFTADAEAVRCRVHGLTPWPGVGVLWRGVEGKARPMKLCRVASEAAAGHGAEPGTVIDPDAGLVATGSGAVRLLAVQPAGKAVMAYADFARGHRPARGDRITSAR